jgi:hypothetical protein
MEIRVKIWGVFKNSQKKRDEISFHPLLIQNGIFQQARIRCLTASNIKIPAATETFND